MVCPPDRLRGKLRGGNLVSGSEGKSDTRRTSCITHRPREQERAARLRGLDPPQCACITHRSSRSTHHAPSITHHAAATAHHASRIVVERRKGSQPERFSLRSYPPRLVCTTHHASRACCQARRLAYARLVSLDAMHRVCIEHHASSVTHRPGTLPSTEDGLGGVGAA